MKYKFFLTIATVLMMLQACGGNGTTTTTPSTDSAQNAAAIAQVAQAEVPVELKQGIDSVVGMCDARTTEQNIVIRTLEGKVLNIPVEANTQKGDLVTVAGNMLNATVNTDASGSHLVKIKNADNGYTMGYMFLIGHWVSADNKHSIEMTAGGNIATVGFSKSYTGWGYFGGTTLQFSIDGNAENEGMSFENETITVEGITLKKQK